MADDEKSQALCYIKKMELEAYGAVVSAIRSHGDLTEKGKTILEELRDFFRLLFLPCFSIYNYFFTIVYRKNAIRRK